MNLPIPDFAIELCRVLSKHGKKAYLVGGAVRDLITGSPPKDWDLATDALPQEMERIFGAAGYDWLPTGKRFGTVTVFVRGLPLEVTTFRLEGEYRDYRHPAQVSFVGEVEGDLGRRDFTINALAYDPLNGELKDPWLGIRDLTLGQIRAVGEAVERFREDPLRILRGIRLAAEFGFDIEEKTWHAAVRNTELIGRVSAERVRQELNRILTAVHYMKGLELLLSSGLLFLIIPELKESWLFPQYHPAHCYNVLDHTLEAMRYAPGNLRGRLAVLLHDVGKPRLFSRGSDGRGHFYGHNRLGAEMAEEILYRLRYDRRTIKEVAALIREHMLDLKMGPAGMRRLVARLGRDLATELIQVKMADFLAHSEATVKHDLERVMAFFRSLQEVLREGELGISQLAVDGRDVQEILHCRPGPLVGQTLKQLWEEVLADPRKNDREYLLTRISEITSQR